MNRAQRRALQFKRNTANDQGSGAPTTLVAQIHEKITAKLAERSTAQDDLDAKLAAITEAKRDATEDEATEIRTAGESLKALDVELQDLERRDKELKEQQEARDKASALAKEYGSKGKSEPRGATYREDNQREVSFLQDAYRTQFNTGDYEARERISTHMKENRDIATTALGGFILPKYALDAVAEYAAAGAPFANSLYREPEPTTMSIIIPTVTTAASAAAQATQNSAVSETDIAITNVTVPTVTIAGQQDISRQSLELGTGVENLIVRELVQQWHTNLDYEMINDTGASGTIEGLLASDGIGTETYTDASPTVPEFLVALGGAFADVTTAIKKAPNQILMAPRRWEWLLAGVGSDGRPLVQVNQYNSVNEVGRGNPGYGAVGTIRGVPVIVDANVPIALGGGTNEDRVTVQNTNEFYFAAPEQPRVLKFEETGANTLTVKAVVYGYAAFSAERRPGALSVMSGTGLIL